MRFSAAVVTMLIVSVFKQGALPAAQPVSVAAASVGVEIPKDLVVSRDGRRGVWIDEDGTGLWAVERASPAAWGTKRHILNVRSMVRNPVFSPDGDRLAFENIRGGYATGPYGPARQHEWGYIATFDFNTGRISYLDPSFGRDINPVWSADGKTISFTRLREGLPDERITSAAIPSPAKAKASKFAGEGPPLEAFLAAPLVYQPAASPDGRSFAFVAREGRARSIYFARQGAAPVQLVRYADDDGQELRDVAVSNDGALVAFVRGGSPNSRDEVANPRSLPEPPEQQVWIARPSGGGPRLLGAGSDPQFSPDGERLIWLTPRGVVSARLRSVAGGSPELGAPEPLISGGASNLRFSPDGKRLAFERSGSIEIHDLTTGARWGVPRPANASDAAPSWSPDGRALVFRRDLGPQPPRLGDGFAGDFVAKEPWEIWTADMASRSVRRVWKAKPGRGSAYYFLDQDPTGSGAVGAQLFWSASGRIAFLWEADGWRHLYSIPETGGEAMLLTPGEGEVETATLSADRTRLIYSTNIGDMPRRHLSAVPASGGAVERLTSGASSQWAPTALSGGGLAYVDAGWNRPPRVMVRSAAGKAVEAAGPRPAASFPARSFTEPKPVEFNGTGGSTAYGQLFEPAKKKGCGIVFVHGGIRRQMLPGFHYMDVYSNLYELNQYFASRGCVVLSVEYRSSIMHGYDFRNAAGWGSAGASEHQDVLGGAEYLKRRFGLARVGIYGLSWGGYLTAQALARNSDVFAAGFDMAGVHEFPGKGFEHSPIAFVDRWRSPVYLAFGDDDRNVDFSQGVMLSEALRSRRPQVELVEQVFPNEIHDLYLTFDDLVSVYQGGSDFLLTHLRRD